MRKARNIQYGRMVHMLLAPLIICFAALSVLNFVSCSKESPVQTGDTPIVFSACLEEDVTTKGLLNITNLTLESFGVFTGFNSEGGKSDTKDWTYMVNTPYRKNSLNGIFDTNPARYWPVTGQITFLAIAPYDRHITESMDFTANNGYPSFLWSPDSDPKRQIDLCVAVNPDQSKHIEVPLCFHHATSQLYFAANCEKLKTSEFIIIDKISVTNVIGEKRMTVTDTPPYVEWESDAKLPRDAAYELSRAEGHLNEERIPLFTNVPRGREISTDAGSLFIVPQLSDIRITVNYTLYQDTGGSVGVVDQFTATSVVPRYEWKPDTRYRLLLTIHDVTEYERGAVTIQFTPYALYPEL